MHMKYQEKNVLDYLFRFLTLVQLQNRNFVGDIKLIIPSVKSAAIGTKLSGYWSVLKHLKFMFLVLVLLSLLIFLNVCTKTEIKMQGGFVSQIPAVHQKENNITLT